MTTYVFKIRTLTNLHAGSGDAGGYGVVDKLVQRDPTTSLPTIHASGIKGALREFFTEEKKVLTAEQIEQIFGASPKPPKPGEEREAKRGDCRFFNADLLALPMPQDAAPHFRVVQNTANSSAVQSKLMTLGAKNLDLKMSGCPDGNLKDLAEELPVVARNFLDNGVSKNLWYEEIVPRESIFVTCIQAPDGVLAAQLDGAVVQLGGNATVGYGFCQFTQIHPTKP